MKGEDLKLGQRVYYDHNTPNPDWRRQYGSVVKVLGGGQRVIRLEENSRLSERIYPRNTLFPYIHPVAPLTLEALL